MIGFVIPYYQASEDLARCRQCVGRQDVAKKVYIHDNSINNLYFTAAVNIGIKHFLGEADYICEINQDCFLEDGAIKKMVELMQSNPDIGIVSSCNIASEDTDICYDTGGYWAFPVAVSIAGSRHEIKNAIVPWSSAACWLLRPEMIEDIGLLDENLVHFCSDLDYCYTARSRGWEVWRCGGAIGIHRPNSLELTKEMNLRKNRDMEYLLKKWCGGLYHDLQFTWLKKPKEQEIVIFKKGKKNVVG